MRTRREILAMLAAGGAAPALALAPAAPQERQPWSRFRTGRDYPRFVAAVRRMKANRDASSPDSWSFWPNAHMQHCPHNTGYFLAWHRGLLHLFEERLRAIAGSDTLRVPYWDYFDDPQLPAELTSGDSASNPLFEPRKGANVDGALAYAAFADSVKGFARGESSDCFEAKIEAFHNNVHNLIGGRMATMLSPQDVVFWLHHANIDRLWTAWIAEGRGRTMPPSGSPYWAGELTYADDLSLARGTARSGDGLGYRYADLSLPLGGGGMEGGSGNRTIGAPAPAGAPPAEPAPVAPSPPPPAPPPPEAEPVPMDMAPAPAEAPPMAMAPAPVPYRGYWLGGEDYMTYLPLGVRGEMPSAGAAPRLDDVLVVLDGLELGEAGEQGGYFYKLYLDQEDINYILPIDDRFLGTIGPFQIAAAMHHAEGGKVTITLPVGDVIGRIAQRHDLGRLSVFFMRVDSGGPPEGRLIGIGSIELTGRGEG